MPIWNLDAIYTGKYVFKSAIDLLQAGYNEDGVYLIDLPTSGPTPTYCLLDKKWDGGGWMMAMKATRGTTFNYGSNLWTTANTLNPSQVNQNDGNAKFETMNRFAAKDIMARWPDITTTGGSIPAAGSWTWLENNFNSGNRQTLISWFAAGAGSRRFIGDAKTFSGWAPQVFSSQVDVRFYGFNYENTAATPTAKVRWGFGWNENGGGLYPSGNEASNDVFGGIGMENGLYSAGDLINCCQDNTGINRSARVEIYVR
jgi:hypothetical protein